MITVIKPVTSNFLTALPESFIIIVCSVVEARTHYCEVFTLTHPSETQNQHTVTYRPLAIHLVSTLQLLFTHCIRCKLGSNSQKPSQCRCERHLSLWSPQTGPNLW